MAEQLLIDSELKKQLQKKVKNLTRYRQVWEWMEEHKSGEYVMVEDVILMLANFNRESFRQSKSIQNQNPKTSTT